MTMTWGNLIAFAITSFAIALIPGPSALFIIGRSLALGRRGGVLSVVGDALGLIPQIVLVAIGVGALVAASPPLLLAVRLAGAAYLFYLGVQTIRHRHLAIEPEPDPVAGSAVQTRVPAATILRQGFIVGVTNPKSTVFFVAVLPQFIIPANGHAAIQMLMLGGVFLIATLSVGTALAFIAGSARERFIRKPEHMATATGVGGVLMIVLSIILAVLAFFPNAV